MVRQSTGNVTWRQFEDNDKLEIETMIILPHGASAKNLTVEVKDLEVLCVKYQDAKLLQWRLTLPVKSDPANIDWRVEDGNKLIVELVKTRDEVWPQLVGWPIPGTDPIMMSDAELDTLLAAELPSLPAVKEPTSPKEPSSGGAAEEDIDIDDLLDDVIAEEEAADHPLVQQELQAFEEDAHEVAEAKERLEELLKEMQEKDPKDINDEELSSVSKQLEVVNSIEKINKKLRALRSEPTTLANYFKFQDMDIQKARANAGSINEIETELYANEDEQQMSGNELYMKGASLVGDKETVQTGLHYLRLAALHKHDARACIMLFRLYDEFKHVGTGAFFLVFRAQMDDCEPMTNSLCAELHDNGVALFAPLMAVSAYYHQRAARTGATASMIKLANMFQRGCAQGSFDLLKDSKIRDKNRSMEKFNLWLTYAEERASGSAFFAKMDLHINGDLEHEKNYHKAKNYWERTLACTPHLRKISPKVEQKLAELKAQTEVKEEPKSAAMVAAPATTGGETSAAPVAEQTAAKPRPGPPVRSVGGGMGVGNKVGNKLGALEARSGNAHAMMDQSGPQGSDGGKAAAKGAANKKFWERTVTIGVAGFSIYTLLFPLRVVLLGQFYMFVENLKNALFSGFGGGGGMRGGRPGMGF